MGHPGLALARWHQEARRLGTAPEIPPIQRLTQSGFLNRLQLGEGELLRQELCAQEGGGRFRSHSIEAGAQHLVVVERQALGASNRQPSDSGGVAGRPRLGVLQANHHQERDADGAPTRIPIRRVPHSELLRMLAHHAGLFLELAERSPLQAFAWLHEPSRKRQLSSTRVVRAFHEQDHQVLTVETEGHGVRGERRHFLTWARSSASSRSNAPDRIGNRHQVFGSRFSSSRWKLGA